MLESMILKPRPTRAEVTDVANAVLDGTDCIMLSGETAKGKFPLLALTAMHKISLEAESAVHHKRVFDDLRSAYLYDQEVPRNVALAAVEAAIKALATCIVVVTETGRSAVLVAGYRPRCPIFAVCPDSMVVRQLYLYRGVVPVLDAGEPLDLWVDNMDRKIELGLREGWRTRVVVGGCHVVVITGNMPGAGTTNTVRIIKIPEQVDSPKGMHIVRSGTDVPKLDTVAE